MRALVARTDWSGLEEGDYLEVMAAVFALLNQAHPFREGNGRASKMWLDMVSEPAGYYLDYAVVSPGEWNRTSGASGPDYGEYEPHPEPLRELFSRIVREKP